MNSSPSSPQTTRHADASVEVLERFPALRARCWTARPQSQFVTPPRAGYGACSYCNCQAYEGSGYICDNCHHHFDHH